MREVGLFGEVEPLRAELRVRFLRTHWKGGNIPRLRRMVKNLSTHHSS